MSFGRIVALIFGVGGILAGLLIVPSAAAVLGVDREDGFVTTDPYTFERSSNAIVSEDIDVLTDAPAAVVDVFVNGQLAGLGTVRAFPGQTADAERAASPGLRDAPLWPLGV